MPVAEGHSTTRTGSFHRNSEWCFIMENLKSQSWNTFTGFLLVIALLSVLADKAQAGPGGTCSPSDPCANDLCCSRAGYCGSTEDYCCEGCVDNCNCDQPLPPPPPPFGMKCGTAAYWGQGDYRVEPTLETTCLSGRYSIVLISFLIRFGLDDTFELQLAGHCTPSEDPSTNTCQDLARQVDVCQKQNVTVLLSLGGAYEYGPYGFPNKTQAEKTAAYLWNNYFGGSTSDSILGEVKLDGIDLDIEGGPGPEYYPVLIQMLLDLAKENNYKKLYITAAPQCPKPDRMLGPDYPGVKLALDTGLIDYVFVQFYNNECDYRNIDKMIDLWSQWTSDPALSSAKVFLGLPASPLAAGSGYVPPQELIDVVLPKLQVDTNPRYGGLMLWSVYHDYSIGYTNQISNAICEPVNVRYLAAE